MSGGALFTCEQPVGYTLADPACFNVILSTNPNCLVDWDAACQAEYCTCTGACGCTDATACNFNPQANFDDGSCILPDGCTDDTACNYDVTALCDNGSCEYSSCSPCYGDLDGDGLRSVGDLLIVLGDFGCIAGAEPCPGDLTGDGQVNTSDVLDLIGVFGLPCP